MTPVTIPVGTTKGASQLVQPPFARNTVLDTSKPRTAPQPMLRRTEVPPVTTVVISNASIVLNTTIGVGQATFAADSSHAVRIPSAENTGLKTDIAFTVAADTDVNLLFSPDATFQNVTATGNGQVILAPVIKVPDTEQ